MPIYQGGPCWGGSSFLHQRCYEDMLHPSSPLLYLLLCFLQAFPFLPSAFYRISLPLNDILHEVFPLKSAYPTLPPKHTYRDSSRAFPIHLSIYQYRIVRGRGKLAANRQNQARNVNERTAVAATSTQPNLGAKRRVEEFVLRKKGKVELKPLALVTPCEKIRPSRLS